jgi:hypothetical protein
MARLEKSHHNDTAVSQSGESNAEALIVLQAISHSTCDLRKY